MAPPLFEVNRLSSDELKYELSVRGIADVATVETMRKVLRSLLKLEREGTPLDYPSYPFTFQEDQTALEEKVEEIMSLIHEFDGSVETTYKKIFSKFAYALDRVNRVKAATDADRKVRSELLVAVLNLKSDLEKNVKIHERSIVNQTLSVPDLNMIDISDSDGGSDDEMLNSTPVPTTSGHPVNKAPTQPIAKWNIKFTGENRSAELSLSAFLERVEETRIARRASHQNFFDSGIDLFVGKALVWYRSVRRNLRDWASLVAALREEFQPLDYNDKLFEEIKRRTQGPNESIGLYLAVVNNLFDRLTVKVPEAARLKIIRNNLAPFYQTQLALTLADIKSTEELLKVCRKLEARKTVVEGFNHPPSRRSAMLEPDLAYVETTTSTPLQRDLSAAEVNETQTSRTIVCFNCSKAGHVAGRCREPQRRYCYTCKKSGFTRRTCPNCSKPQGNGFQGH